LGGKTGTTNDAKDAWFSGFNPNLVAVAWVGFDQPRTLGRREFGGVAALPIWSDYMANALANTQDQIIQPADTKPTHHPRVRSTTPASDTTTPSSGARIPAQTSLDTTQSITPQRSKKPQASTKISSSTPLESPF
jgi:penicillin-binding protein 1A